MTKYLFWIKALTGEGIVFIGSCFLPFVKKFGYNDKDLSINKKPILFVHGYMNNSFVWFYHAKKLKKFGFGPIFTINLEKPFSSIKDHSKKLEEKVKKIEEITNRSDIVLIGHSMGGLVASYYAMNLAKEGNVSDVITIASPLNGTHLAILGLGKSAKEMRINSDFVNELHTKIKNQKNINFYHIATQTDQLVQPYTSSLVGKNLEKQFVLKGVGHASLLYSKKVNSKIIQWLNQEVEK